MASSFLYWSCLDPVTCDLGIKSHSPFSSSSFSSSNYHASFFSRHSKFSPCQSSHIHELFTLSLFPLRTLLSGFTLTNRNLNLQKKNVQKFQNFYTFSNMTIRSQTDYKNVQKIQKNTILKNSTMKLSSNEQKRLGKNAFDNKLFFASITVNNNNNNSLNASKGFGGIRAGWVSLGVVLTFFFGVCFSVFQSERFARSQLVATEEDSVFFPPLSPEMVESYERAKSVVLQDRLVDNAISAMRTNDLMRCVVQLELALEENKIARMSLEADLRDQEELCLKVYSYLTNFGADFDLFNFFQMVELYSVALKYWSDGYPLDFGKLLQLRNLLNVSSDLAEQIEEEIQSQSASFVI